VTAPLPLCTIDTHRPATIGRICWRHHDALADLLDPTQHGTRYNPERPDDPRVLPSIPAMYAMLDASPRTGPAVIGSSSAFGSRPPADLHVIALRDPRSACTGPAPDDDGLTGPWSTLATLATLAERVDRRDIHGNRIHPPRHPSVPTLARWLHLQLDWLCHQTWIDEVWTDLRTLSAQLRGAIGDAPARPVGACRTRVDDDGHETPNGPWSCGWPLHMPTLPPRAPDDPPVLPVLRCGSCGHRYTGAELAQLGQPAEAMEPTP
jgi:hypothetical protein